MKYPAYFIMLVNGIYWKIKYTYDVNELRRDNGTIALGVCVRNKLTIYIYKGLSYNLQNKVLIHEITHAYIFSYGYMITEEEEELICEIVSEYGENIIKDSKKILEKIFEKSVYKSEIT